jgi:predicted SAM-dependent methyltransferase
MRDLRRRWIYCVRSRDSTSRIERYLREHEVRKLQIGSGSNCLSTWLNTDLEPVFPWTVALNATKDFPIPESSFHFVFTEHMIEHLPYHAGLFMLRECHRVLRPGGYIRIATPDLRRITALLLPDPTAYAVEYLRYAVENHWPEPKIFNGCYLLNQFLHSWGHAFVYDAETLREVLSMAGFQEIAPAEVGISEKPELCGIEHHGKQIGDKWNRFETMVFEARKPLA